MEHCINCKVQTVRTNNLVKGYTNIYHSQQSIYKNKFSHHALYLGITYKNYASGKAQSKLNQKTETTLQNQESLQINDTLLS